MKNVNELINYFCKELFFVFCLFFFETDFRLEKKQEKILSNLLTMRYIDDERDPLENKEEKL